MDQIIAMIAVLQKSANNCKFFPFQDYFAFFPSFYCYNVYIQNCQVFTIRFTGSTIKLEISFLNKQPNDIYKKKLFLLVCIYV